MPESNGKDYNFRPDVAFFDAARASGIENPLYFADLSIQDNLQINLETQEMSRKAELEHKIFMEWLDRRCSIK